MATIEDRIPSLSGKKTATRNGEGSRNIVERKTNGIWYGQWHEAFLLMAGAVCRHCYCGGKRIGSRTAKTQAI